jgi:hypothetical protein
VLRSGENELLPVKLKFQNKIHKSDYRGLHLFPAKKGILLLKNVFDVSENYATIPVSLFLLLILDGPAPPILLQQPRHHMHIATPCGQASDKTA